MAYIERNPVRAQLARRAEEWAWSSARLRRAAEAGASSWMDLTFWQETYDWPRWAEVLATSVDEEGFGQRLQEASRRGRPFAANEFIDELEKRSGRRLRAMPVGRPKKVRREDEGQLSLGYCV